MADRYQTLVLDALKEAGAILVRQRVHAVYRFPNGKCWTVPQTASDRRAWQNAWTNLRLHLGLVDPDRGAEGERREKATKTPPSTRQLPMLNTIPPPPTLHQKLGRIKLGLPKKPKPTGEPREPVDVSGLLAKWSAKP